MNHTIALYRNYKLANNIGQIYEKLLIADKRKSLLHNCVISNTNSLQGDKNTGGLRWGELKISVNALSREYRDCVDKTRGSKILKHQDTACASILAIDRTMSDHNSPRQLCSRIRKNLYFRLLRLALSKPPGTTMR